MARLHPAARLAPVALLAAWLAVYAVTARLSDDGLHAYAARAVLHGQRLYVDFEYHQAPLLPYALALWFRIVGVGMTQAKLFSALVAALTLLAMTALARRHGADERLTALLLFAAALSPSLVLHLQYVQSQGLAALLACLALLAHGKRGQAKKGYDPSSQPDEHVGAAVEEAPDRSCVQKRRDPSLDPLFLGVALAALAAAARISFVVLLPALLWRRPWRQIVVGVLVWAAVLGAWLAPHVLHGRLADMLYLPFGAVGNLVTQRYVGLYSTPGGWAEAIGSRVGSWPNQFIYYAPLWVLVGAAAFAGRRAPGASRLLAVAVLLTLAHGVLPRRVNHSYLVVAMPVWAAWAAARLAGRPLPRPRLVLTLLLLGGVAAVSRGVGRVDLSGGRTVLAELGEIGTRIQHELPPDGRLLTFCIEAAVAADRDVLDGFAPGYFAYFPNMSDAEAAQAKVVNTTGLLRALDDREADLLLLHEAAFEPLEKPAVPWPDTHRCWAWVARGYRPVAAWDAAGEKRQRLTLYARR